MPTDSALRLKQLIQAQGHARPLPASISPEAAALCVLVDEMAERLSELETALSRLRPGPGGV